MSMPGQRTIALTIMRRVVIVRIVVLCVLGGCFVFASQQTGASRVALATVVDSRNRPIVDLDADDFVIHEGADAREILSVHVADYPVVVMIDTGSDARSDLPAMQKAAAQFIRRIGQRPVALGIFGDPPEMLTSVDEERPKLMERLDAMPPMPPMPPSGTGASVLLQGAALAARTLRPIGSLFSAIVMLSASSIDASPDVDALVSPIVDAGVILHVVANRIDRAPARSGEGETTLRALIDQTHGQYTTIYTAASFRAALDHIADRLATEIMIEYLVPAQSKATDVKIGVRIPGARVRGFGVAPR
jgi:hypothetical protein